MKSPLFSTIKTMILVALCSSIISVPTLAGEKNNILQTFSRITESVTTILKNTVDGKTTPENAAIKIELSTKSLTDISGGKFDVSAILPQASKIIKLHWKSYLRNRKALVKLHNQGVDHQRLIEAVKVFEYNAQFLSDISLESQHAHGQVNQQEVNTSFQKEAQKTGYTIIKHPKLKDAAIESGDVILVRGTSVISSIISNLTDVPGYFSHIGIAYRDSDKKLWIIEIDVKISMRMVPIEHLLESKRPRLMIFRHPDKSLSKRAGAMAAKLYEEFKQGTWEAKYDLGASFSDNYEKINCLEFVRLAFDRASGGTFLFPEIKSSFARYQGVLAPFGLNTAYASAAPIDAKFSQLRPIMSLSNPEKTRSSRIKDAITTLSFQLIKEQGASFPSNKLYTSFARALRWAVRDQLPDGFGSSLMEFWASMNYHGYWLERVMKRLEKRRLSRGRIMRLPDIQKAAYLFRDQLGMKYRAIGDQVINLPPPRPSIFKKTYNRCVDRVKAIFKK